MRGKKHLGYSVTNNKRKQLVLRLTSETISSWLLQFPDGLQSTSLSHKMRTSASQFDALVSFMERHGDLNKIADGPQGRVRAIQLWEDLCNLLNLDVAGDSKSIDKWKKVWSDFKNNTKRKSAKIQAAGGTSATKLALSDLESRVLRLTGTSGNSSMMGAQDSGVEYVVPTNDWPGQNTLLVEKNLSSKSSTSDDDVKLHNFENLITLKS
ncbi:jg24000 [Pararge aegeria aegeria]|uniref:Jg24000 protein n=1 Tax=Pararge aegeria aegeria TaxID=348720 RepID=A0A8S4SQT3_9NEOP|nr:jg24000 [Pararge aegeria aegeria]